MSVTRRVRLLTVVGPGGRHDVAAAAEASLVFLMPVLIDLAGGEGAEVTNPRWALYDEDGRVLRRGGTLLSEQVLDGSVLVLSESHPGAPPPVPVPARLPEPTETLLD